MKLIIAVLLPPLGVALTGRWGAFFLNLLLCFLLWVPGIIHACFVVLDYDRDRREERKEERRLRAWRNLVLAQERREAKEYRRTHTAPVTHFPFPNALPPAPPPRRSK